MLFVRAGGGWRRVGIVIPGHLLQLVLVSEDEHKLEQRTLEASVPSALQQVCDLACNLFLVQIALPVGDQPVR